MVTSISCRLCGDSLAPVWFNAWDYAIHACSKCDFMFAVPLANEKKPYYEPDYYCEFIERDKQSDMLQFYSGILEELEQMTAGRRLLDAGCGAGDSLILRKKRLVCERP